MYISECPHEIHCLLFIAGPSYPDGQEVFYIAHSTLVPLASYREFFMLPGFPLPLSKALFLLTGHLLAAYHPACMCLWFSSLLVIGDDICNFPHFLPSVLSFLNPAHRSLLHDFLFITAFHEYCVGFLPLQLFYNFVLYLSKVMPFQFPASCTAWCTGSSYRGSLERLSLMSRVLEAFEC